MNKLTKRENKMKTKYIKNNKMNDATYVLRRKVIDILYEARNHGIRLPRINVRIGNPTKGNENVLGVGGRLNIWITEKAIDRGYNYLLHVTLHELGHAVYNLDHDENCKLMASSIGTPCDAREAWAIFRKYSYNGFIKEIKKAIA
tara:strand:- start:275 stop:709 length:435 start_codon:yes stop_codon:yes gene_type:complete